MMVVMMPLMVYAKCVGPWFKRIAKNISDQAAVCSEVAQESFGNIRTVKAFGTEDWQTHLYRE